jgi:ankyrin repeat protein
MKYLLVGLLSGMAIGSFAQAGGGNPPVEGQRSESKKGSENRPQGEGGMRMQENRNPLLNQSFWQGNPDVEAIKAEIAKGNNPSEMNPMAFDPVVMAINANSPAASIKYLIDQPGNDVNKLTHDGRTYVFWAAMRGNTEVMEYVLSKGAKATMVDSHGATPLTFAAGGGQQNTAVYNLLAQHGANLKTEVNNDGANALLLAIGNDPELKLTGYFQSQGLDLNSKDAAGNNAADYAARSGNIETLKKLAAKGVKPTDNAMLMAAQGGRRGGPALVSSLPVFQYLEGVGVKPTATNKNGETVLHNLVRRPGQLEAIKWFVSKGVNVNTADVEGNTVFMNAAASTMDTATLAYLRPLVKDINQKNRAGASALALAIRGSLPEVAAYLLNNGADISTTDAKGNNLVYYLFESYNPRATMSFEPKMKLLQAKGLNFAAPQKDGSTVYHLAVAKNDMGLLQMVQPLGADINAKNGEGITALHKAAMMSKDAVILQYLVSIGAKKDAKTKFDETAYDLAKENEVLNKQNVSVDFLKL